MKYAVIGGDERAAFLAVRLLEAGHSVRCWALEKSALAARLPQTGCLEGCVYGADWVLLPVPAEREGKLNAPLSVQGPAMPELLTALWPGQVLCGGGFRCSGDQQPLSFRTRFHLLLRSCLHCRRRGL